MYAYPAFDGNPFLVVKGTVLMVANKPVNSKTALVDSQKFTFGSSQSILFDSELSEHQIFDSKVPSFNLQLAPTNG